METRRDVFHAIADPTRRAIIDVIAKQRSLNLNSIADQFDVSRQAISIHVKVLTECGLVVVNKHGRERICTVQLKNLKEAATWIDQYKTFWHEQFISLEKYLDKKKKPRK